jgi:hypothetical protein
MLLRWNGQKWNQTASGTGNLLREAWQTSATEAWAVGDGGTILLFDP